MSTGRQAAAILLSLVLYAGCAGGPAPVTDPGAREGRSEGLRVLFRVTSAGPEGRSSYRIGAAVVPPSRARLEFIGPVGGPRLIVATDGSRSVALLPSERRYDASAADPAAMERLLGLPLDGERLVALLSGKPICEPAAPPGDSVPPAGGEAGGSIVCRQGDVVLQGLERTRDGRLSKAHLRDARSGALLAEITYGDARSSPPLFWPKEIRIRLAQRDLVVDLKTLQGPAATSLDDRLFTPEIPVDFKRQPLFDGTGVPAFAGRGGGASK